MYTFNHFNFNVADLDRSLAFYKEALGLEPIRRKEAEDGSFVIVFLGDRRTTFRLELTWLRDHPQKYDRVCFEDPAMGIYFITDPDGYWIEIIP